jgi:multidrug efflux pump subunit AcrB
MTGVIDWAASRARMVVAFILLSIAAGITAYVSLPKEGEPDIDIPALFVSVPFPGISAADSETLLVKVMEQELSGLDGLKRISGTAAEGYGGVALEFEFGWDKTQTIADVRDRMNTAEAKFPAGADKYSITEINFSEFPILVIALSGNVPERTLLRPARDMQKRVAALEPVLKAELSGHRDEMLEVVIDPLKLEALRNGVTVTASLDQSTNVEGMVKQLEGSVLTAIALVMIVVLATLGTRSALLVGFAIPTTFLLTFAFFAALGFTVSNIVMFGLILAVGMLVDSAIVVVEYADKRIQEGSGPMSAYTEAAKRMFWPIVSSTATTLCAFLPMLFWPGVAGEFMGVLPITLIFVLCAALLVALLYLPVMGGVAGRISRRLEAIAARPLRRAPVVSAIAPVLSGGPCAS